MRPKGTIGLFLLAFRVWQRLSPSQRAVVLSQLRRHGPRAAAALAGLMQSRRGPRKRPARGR